MCAHQIPGEIFQFLLNIGDLLTASIHYNIYFYIHICLDMLYSIYIFASFVISEFCIKYLLILLKITYY